MTGSPGTDQRRRRGPARSLSRADLLEAGLSLADVGGAAAFSLRRLAAASGVTANALYTYFPTKRHLEHALADELLRRSAAQAGDAVGRSGVLAVADSLRDLLLAHRGAFPFLMGSPWTGPGGLALSERALAALVGAGLDPATASRTAYALIAYALGTIALDLAEGEQHALQDDAARTAERRRDLASVGVVGAPLTAATLDSVAQYNSRDQYLWGVDRLLDGVLGAVRGARAEGPRGQ